MLLLKFSFFLNYDKWVDYLRMNGSDKRCEGYDKHRKKAYKQRNLWLLYLGQILEWNVQSTWILAEHSFFFDISNVVTSYLVFYLLPIPKFFSTQFSP